MQGNPMTDLCAIRRFRFDVAFVFNFIPHTISPSDIAYPIKIIIQSCSLDVGPDSSGLDPF